MFDCKKVEENGYTWLCFEGRIDALSATEIDKTMNALITDGERVFGADLEKVNYISSAGLRAFTVTQKKLRKAGGEIVLASVPSNILEIFRMTGLDKLFRFAGNRQAAGTDMAKPDGTRDDRVLDVDGIAIRYLEKPAGAGLLSVFGDHKKMETAAYDESDVIPVPAATLAYGAGLGTLGDEYDDFKGLFGEAVVIDRNFFFYPAVKNPAVDFMLCSREDEATSLMYRFFHGFGFEGGFRYILSFEGGPEWVTLSRLVRSLFEVSSADILGVVFLAESKGVWGMHLKKVPIIDNRPENQKSIFEGENFSDWFNFPVDPGDINRVVVGTGIAGRSRNTMPRHIREIMAEESPLHFHGGIYSKGPLNNDLQGFEKELH
ncbi:MAG: STAS domain-containing protein, partial [Deltaproteobacteria bacterium]|nr:STAS domain-containing protein [Deltaproteobacteria bacterium]